jgi:hypothetical protein
MTLHRRPTVRTQWPPSSIAIAAAMWQREIVDRYGDDEGDVPRGAKARVYTLIARQLGVTYATVEGRRLLYGPSFNTPRFVAAEQRADADWRLPPHLLAERDARKLASDLRDLTAELMGDPPPGYSALERRR